MLVLTMKKLAGNEAIRISKPLEIGKLINTKLHRIFLQLRASLPSSRRQHEACYERASRGCILRIPRAKFQLNFVREPASSTDRVVNKRVTSLYGYAAAQKTLGVHEPGGKFRGGRGGQSSLERSTSAGPWRRM